MTRRDVVAVGGSAGGVEALKRLVSDLPADLPATVLVSLHLSPHSRSMLPDLLARRTKLRVVEAQDGLPLEPGLVVVARPDHHLLVVDDAVALGRGARENGYRPSHDAMLRSVAVARGARAVGVVLTGLLDDGAAGLHVVRRYGGACVVQDPSDAEFSSMPEHALAAVPDACCVPLSGLAEEVTRLVNEDPADPEDTSTEQYRVDQAEVASARGAAPRVGGDTVGLPSRYSCPDCAGVLNEVPDQGSLRFRCRTGHAWTAESLLHQQAVDVETALVTALRVLEERVDISTRLAESSGVAARESTAEHYRRRAQDAAHSAEVLRSVLNAHISTAGDSSS